MTDNAKLAVGNLELPPIVEYAHIDAESKIDVFGALPFLWSANEGEPKIDLHALSDTVKAEYGWVPLYRVGVRPYDVQIEKEIVGEPTLGNGIATVIHSYEYLPDWKQTIVSRISQGATRASPSIAATMIDALKGSINDQERIIIESTLELGALTATYNRATNGSIEYNGYRFQTSEQTKTRLLTAIGMFDPNSTYNYWVDTSNEKIPVDEAFLKGLLQAIVDRDRVLFDKLQADKAAVRDSVMEKLST